MKKSTELLGEIKKKSGKGWRNLGELTGFGTYWSEAFYYDRLPNMKRAAILLDKLKINGDLKEQYLNTVYIESVAQNLETKGLFVKNLTQNIDDFITLLKKWTESPSSRIRYIMSTCKGLLGTDFAQHTRDLLRSEAGGGLLALKKNPLGVEKRIGGRQRRDNSLNDSAELQD